MRLLIIDDDEHLAVDAAKALRSRGFAIDIASDGVEGYELLKINDYDLAILEANLSGISGIEICKRLRAEKSPVLLLMLSSHSQPRERVAGLNSGADDYLSKPFDFEELVARIQALLRRDLRRRGTVLTLDDLTLDVVGRQAYLGDAKLNLTSKEFSILEYLMSHVGEVVGPQQLLEHAWDAQADSFSNAVRVHMAALRKKLGDSASEPHYIETVAGQGYRMCVPDHNPVQ